MLNLTPHPITIVREDGSRVTFEPSGLIARVATTETQIGIEPTTGVPVVSRTLGQPQGLPEEGTPCLVSAMVLGACPGRRGVFAPDSGPTAIRNAQGQIEAVTRLVAA